MSAPRSSWTWIAFSGVKKWRLPSRWERNSTPDSKIRRRRARLKTWKPPLSVSMGPAQRLKAWRPPTSAIHSAPGRRYRW